MTLNPSLDGLQERVAVALKRHTTYFLVEGIVLIILGFAAIAVPFVATLTFTIFFGWLLLISGVVGLVSTFSLRPAAGFWWSLLSAILAIAVGFLLIARPGQGAVSLTLLLIVFFIIEGFSSIIFATEYRQNLSGRWGWMVASGVVDLLLAGMIFLQLPSSAIWAIGLLLGINMVFGGTTLVMLALDAKKVLPPT
ncbi:MAG: HdeD family acid-resistance protein [Methylovirgula sp.]|uniref:HdeD family acid-resistance protein n=1 Tax=Methylovirgula sp. TaxID=1978224 RepID=UPI003075EE0B